MIRDVLIFSCALWFIAAPGARASSHATPSDREATAQNEMNEAIDRVAAIVNQPVTHLPLKDASGVGYFSPGWFHEGAFKPDFDTVDVRRTQEFPYAKFDYVTSDLNPGEMFPANDLEFNSMTKYFYTDRSVPKKRLSEEEMLEINRLYRIIGHDEAVMRSLNRPLPDPRFLILVLVSIPVILFIMWKKKKR